MRLQSALRKLTVEPVKNGRGDRSQVVPDLYHIGTIISPQRSIRRIPDRKKLQMSTHLLAVGRRLARCRRNLGATLGASGGP
jgi:hypothetical protein